MSVIFGFFAVNEFFVDQKISLISSLADFLANVGFYSAIRLFRMRASGKLAIPSERLKIVVIKSQILWLDVNRFKHGKSASVNEIRSVQIEDFSLSRRVFAALNLLCKFPDFKQVAIELQAAKPWNNG